MKGIVKMSCVDSEVAIDASYCERLKDSDDDHQEFGYAIGNALRAIGICRATLTLAHAVERFDADGVCLEEETAFLKAARALIEAWEKSDEESSKEKS